MAIIRFAGFAGENRALHPALLGESVCTVSLNQKPGRGDLRPLRAPTTVATVPAGRQTIYRAGRDVASDTNYWLSFTGVVHVVRGFNAADTGERTFFTGSGTPKWTDASLAVASEPYPTAYRELGVPAPTTPPIVTAAGGTSTLNRTVSVAYTFVNNLGEESAPSPPSTLLTSKQDATLTIASISNPLSGAYGIDRVRVYRTQESTGGGDFYFLREIASGVGSTTDDGRTLGEVLPSATWLMPPADLRNLTGLWNGMMAGISGRTVRFCEAYKPYAWPLAYEIAPAKSSPVALGAFGQTLVILTDDRPISINGGTPEALDEMPVDFLQSCVASRSVVSMGHGIVWASPDGLCYIGQGGARVLTEGVLTRDDWQALNPSSIVASLYERRYLAFHTVGGVTKGFVMDPMNPAGMFFFDFGAQAVYFDDLQDQLYILSGSSVQRWDAGSGLTTTVKSKLHRSPKPLAAYGCAQVIADGYPCTFKLYADGTLKHTQTVTSAVPFRLPSGYYSDTTQLELSTNSQILYCAVAHSMLELAQT